MHRTPGTSFCFGLSLLLFVIILIALRSAPGRSSDGTSATVAMGSLDPEKAHAVSGRRSLILLMRMLPWFLLDATMSTILPDTRASRATGKQGSDWFSEKDISRSGKHALVPDHLYGSFGRGKAREQQGGKKEERQGPCAACLTLGQDHFSPPFQTLIALPAVAVAADAAERMRYEQNRFTSFHLVPDALLPPATRPICLARGGFYFDWTRRAVLCFSCGGQYPSPHLPDCTRLVEDVPFSQAPPPPPPQQPPSPDDPQLLNVVARTPSQQACTRPNPYLPGGATSGGAEQDGHSAGTPVYATHPDARPANDPIRRHGVPGQELEIEAAPLPVAGKLVCSLCPSGRKACL